ncbi:MAG: glycosyl hydrolase-related protein, partial [Bacillota bacterium]
SGPADGRERPTQKWVDLSGQLPQSPRSRGGLALINRGKYSYQAEGNQLTMTCLRSPIYAHHDPEQPREQEDYDYIDQGEQEFTYRIFPHTDGWQQTELARQAYQFNQPPIPVIETFHRGELPAEASFLEVEADNVIVSVLKIAEDSDDIILRGFETDGKAVTARIKLTLLNRELDVDFKPFQIKTLRIPVSGEEQPEEVNLLEN